MSTSKPMGPLYGDPNAPVGQQPPGALDKANGRGGKGFRGGSAGGTITPYVPYIPPPGQGQYQSGIPGSTQPGGIAPPQGMRGPSPVEPSPVAASGGGGYHGSWGQGYMGHGKAPAPTPEESAAADPNQVNVNNEYVAKFNASVATQRAAIDNALTSALTSLGARRDAASKVVAGIPQQIKDTYDQTDTKQSQVMGTANKSIGGGAGGGGSVGGNANASLYANDNEAAKKSGLSVQPLLQAGVQSNYDLGEANLNAEHLAGINSIAAQEANFNASMAAGAQNHQYTVEDRQWLIDHPEADPSNRMTDYQRAQLASSTAQAEEEKRRYNDESQYKKDSDARAEGYTSVAGRELAQKSANYYKSSGQGKLNTDTIRSFTPDMVTAYLAAGIITKDQVAKATGA